MPHEISAIIKENHPGSVKSQGPSPKRENSSLQPGSKSIFRVKTYSPPAIIEQRSLRIDLMKDTAKSAEI